MKRLLLILILLYSKSFAQENAETAAPDTLYFTKFYKETDKGRADIIRIIEGTDSEIPGFNFKEFDKEGKLEKSGIIKEIKGHPIGKITSYYENGATKEEGNMDKIRTGLWKVWYQNGQLKEEVVYEELEGGKQSVKMINYYDSTGNHLIVNGAGLFKEYYKNDVKGQLRTIGSYTNYQPAGEWLGYHANGSLYYNETFNDRGELLNGVSYDTLGNRYEYDQQGVNPSPVGDMDGLYRYFMKTIKYPKTAVRGGIQGRVYVQFVVGKEGNITDVEVVKGIDKNCDEEAARVIKLMKKWKPGMQRGQPVKVRMVLPLLFKLS